MKEAPIVQKIKDHLRSVTDLTLLVLKSHLLVEEQINWVLEEILPNPIAIDDGRLTFYQRVKLLRSINNVDSMEKVLEFTEKLNRIRNQLAHNLEPVGVEDAVKKFATDVAASMPVKLFEVTGPPNLHMAMCVGYLCGMLHAFRDATRIVQTTIDGEDARHH